MNRIEDNLQRLIALVGNRERQNMVVAIGTVQNIDEQKRSCQIKLNDDLTLFNCRLNAVLDNYQNRLLIVPKDQSAVAFMAVDGNLTDPIIIARNLEHKILLAFAAFPFALECCFDVFGIGTPLLLFLIVVHTLLLSSIG